MTTTSTKPVASTMPLTIEGFSAACHLIRRQPVTAPVGTTAALLAAARQKWHEIPPLRRGLDEIAARLEAKGLSTEHPSVARNQLIRDVNNTIDAARHFIGDFDKVANTITAPSKTPEQLRLMQKMADSSDRYPELGHILTPTHPARDRHTGRYMPWEGTALHHVRKVAVAPKL